MIFVKTIGGKLVADISELAEAVERFADAAPPSMTGEEALLILAYSLRKATEVRCDCSKCEVS